MAADHGPGQAAAVESLHLGIGQVTIGFTVAMPRVPQACRGAYSPRAPQPQRRAYRKCHGATGAVEPAVVAEQVEHEQATARPQPAACPLEKGFVIKMVQ